MPAASKASSPAFLGLPHSFLAHPAQSSWNSKYLQLLSASYNSGLTWDCIRITWEKTEWDDWGSEGIHPEGAPPVVLTEVILFITHSSPHDYPHYDAFMMTYKTQARLSLLLNCGMGPALTIWLVCAQDFYSLGY